MKISRRDAKRLGLPLPHRKATKDDTGHARRLFLEACKANGLPEPVPEFMFHAERKWRLDWWWGLLCVGSQAEKLGARGVALEIDGGVFVDGAHTRGRQIIKDHEKRNEAVLMGIWVLLCTPDDIKSGSVFELLRRVLGRSGGGE